MCFYVKYYLTLNMETTKYSFMSNAIKIKDSVLDQILYE